MSDNTLSLIAQRNLVQLRLQVNRRLFVEQLCQEQSEFPLSQTFKIIAQPSTQAWLTNLSQKLFGIDVPNLITQGIWLARYVKGQMATRSTEESPSQ